MAKEKKLQSFNDFTEENLLDKPEIKDATAADIDDPEVIEEPEVEEKKKTTKVEKKTKKVVAEKEEDEKVEGDEPDEKKDQEPEPKDSEEEEGDFASPEEFFAEVEKLTGQELDVDYGEVNPLSPQGVALREAAVKEAALDTFLGEIEEKFPMVFRALKHANNGGDIAELFSQVTTRDYTKVSLKEEDTDLAKEILKDYYKSKGVKNEAKIAKLIENDEDSPDGLVKEAAAALEELKAEQTEKSNTILEAQSRKAADDRKRDQILVTAVDEVIDTRDLGGFKIADKGEAAQFRDYVLSNLRKVGEGKYELATQLDSSNLAKALQYQYFQFKKGDLSKIVRQKVDTEGAKRLSLRMKADQDKFKKTTQQEDKSRQAQTLKSYNV